MRRAVVCTGARRRAISHLLAVVRGTNAEHGSNTYALALIQLKH